MLAEKLRCILIELKKVSNCYYCEHLPAHSPLHYTNENARIFMESSWYILLSCHVMSCHGIPTCMIYAQIKRN